MHFESLLDAIFTAVAYAFNYKPYVSLTLAGEKACLFTMNRATMCMRCSRKYVSHIFAWFFLTARRSGVWFRVKVSRLWHSVAKALVPAVALHREIGTVWVFKDNLKLIYTQNHRVHAKQKKNKNIYILYISIYFFVLDKVKNLQIYSIDN